MSCEVSVYSGDLNPVPARDVFQSPTLVSRQRGSPKTFWLPTESGPGLRDDQLKHLQYRPDTVSLE